MNQVSITFFNRKVLEIAEDLITLGNLVKKWLMFSLDIKCLAWVG
jgi:hypothetical protein